LETQKIFDQIDALQQEMVDSLIKLLRVPAVAPENGGDGEQAKAQVLMQMLSKVGFDRIDRYDSDDPRVPSGKRPNILAYINGAPEEKRLWVITHLDVVPPGEESLWKITKPYKPKVQNNCVYGRGSEDNGQPLISSLFAAVALKRLGIKPKHTLGLAFVSDEEQGSGYGIRHLLKQNIFRQDDLVVVPDSGSPTGDFIEISEKNLLWFKLTTHGKQAHGSLPTKGLNAHRIGMQAALEIDKRLHEKYNARDDYFDVPYSTFEPTKKDKNVDAVNIVPGEDILYFDCRILPRYNPKDYLADIQAVISEIETQTGAKITLEIIQNEFSPALKGEPQAVALLKRALKEGRGIEARVGGVGGGTCAAYFRKADIPAIVWSTIDEIPHQPDEYARIPAMVADAKTYVLMACL
jgi:succinyl-diaminopimelate desuccinylase